MDAYRSTLRQTGVPVFEIERQLGRLTDRMSGDMEGWRWMFNRVYAAAEYQTMLPNLFLARVVEALTPGRALDVCLGQGRNSLYLASKGWRVTGFDVAEQGLTLARANARRIGAALHVIRSTEQAFSYGRSLWDLIVINYAPIEVTGPRFVSKIKRALRPGGKVLIESFAFDSRLGRTRMGALEIDPAQLLQAFADFAVETYEEVEALPDWGACSSRIIRLCAQAPPPCTA